MTKRLRPVQVRRGDHPFEVAALGAALLCGVTLIVLDTQPASVQTAMTGTVQTLWQILLTVSGMVGLVGALWRGRLAAALGTELVGVIVLASATTMYSIALWSVSGIRAIGAGTFVTAYALGCWWRSVQIVHDLVLIARATRDGKHVEVPLLVEEKP